MTQQGRTLEQADACSYTPIIGTTCDDANPATINDVYVDNCTCAGVDISLNIKVFLGGAYQNSTGLMRTNLVNNGLLPVTQPYQGAPWNYLSMDLRTCLLYTSPSPRDLSTSRMPSSA